MADRRGDLAGPHRVAGHARRPHRPGDLAVLRGRAAVHRGDPARLPRGPRRAAAAAGRPGAPGAGGRVVGGRRLAARGGRRRLASTTSTSTPSACAAARSSCPTGTPRRPRRRRGRRRTGAGCTWSTAGSSSRGRRRGERYDVVIVDLPDEPVEVDDPAQHARLYGIEFLRRCAAVLAPRRSGVFAGRLPHAVAQRPSPGWPPGSRGLPDGAALLLGRAQWAYLTGRLDSVDYPGGRSASLAARPVPDPAIPGRPGTAAGLDPPVRAARSCVRFRARGRKRTAHTRHGRLIAGNLPAVHQPADRRRCTLADIAPFGSTRRLACNLPGRWVPVLSHVRVLSTSRKRGDPPPRG